MKVNIDFQRNEEQIKKASNQFIVRDYIEFAISQVYKDGVNGPLLAKIAKIQRLLDESVDKNQEEIAFDAADMDLIRDTIEKTTFDPSLAKYVILLQDELKK